MFVIDPLCALQLALFLEAPERGPQGHAGRGRPQQMGAERGPLQRARARASCRSAGQAEACGTGGRGAHHDVPECHCGPAGAVPGGASAPGSAAGFHGGGERRAPRQLRAPHRRGLRWGPGKNARARVTQKPLVTVVGPRKAWWRMPAQGVSARTRDRDRWPDFTHRTQAPLYGQRALSPPGLADFMHSKY